MTNTREDHVAPAAERIEWGVDWFAGGNPREADHSEKTLVLAECAAWRIIAREWAAGIPATEDEYNARTALAEEAAEAVLERNTVNSVYNDRFEWFSVWVRVGGKRWADEEV